MEVDNYLKEVKSLRKADKGPHWFTRFLWWCAGADPVILRRCPMNDRVKYAGIGGVVFCTGLLAAVSGGFAYYTIFAPKGDAVHDSAIHWNSVLSSGIFAFVWGMIILNLDRFIVSSTGKGDGKDSISIGEVGRALPRIIIALILGFAISAPLEVRILKSEIDANLQKVQEDYKMELDLQTDSNINMQVVRYEEKIAVVEVKLQEYEDYVEKRRLELNDQYVKLELEAEGRSGTGHAGRGPAWKDKKDNLDRQKASLDQYIDEKKSETDNLKGDREKLHEQIDELDASRQQKKEENYVVAHQLDGLLKRVQISHEIGGIIPWVILLVFLCIEMGPIFFKMMMTKGVYDYMVLNMDKKLKAYNGIVQKEEIFKDEKGNLHKEYYQYLEVKEEIDEKIKKLQEQSERSNQIIEAWSAQKSQEIQDDPGRFYEPEGEGE
jgi:hypothetical protein